MVRGRLPGAVIGQVFRSAGSPPRDLPRYTGIIAKGLDIKLFRDAAIARCAVEGEQLPFSGITYNAPLAHPAIPDKGRCRLYTSDGRTVSVARWNFTQSIPGSNVFDTVSIDPSIFSTSVSYLLDYVTTDTTRRDDIPVDDLRELLLIGDNQGQVRYKEGRDFRLTTTATGPLPGIDNINPTQRTTSPAAGSALNNVFEAGSTDSVVKVGSGAYTHDYNRNYIVSCTSAPAGSPFTATFRVDCVPTSSGAGALPGLSEDHGNSIFFTVDQGDPSSLTQSLEHGLTLTFQFGSTNFFAGSSYAFSALGPGLFELDDKLRNTNQFAEISSVSVPDSNSGTGAITINPQSVYSGATNQVYEVQCVEATNNGLANATARFFWRTNPKLKLLSGSLTAVHNQTSVAGSGTAFLTDVQPGDYLLIGSCAAPVRVQAVNSNIALTLEDAFPFATQTGRTLRIRQSYGEFTVVANGSPNRVSVDQGVLLDFDFGNNNFLEGDTFSFTALVASNPYNGKENRNYDFSITSTSAKHAVTATYVGNTPASTFGSHIFSEGTPLVLPNNTVVHARNLSAPTSRFSAVLTPNQVPDTFELSLTFDGQIDWNLETEVTETIGSQDILRDLTGSVTGTVGAYFVLLRKKPSSVLFVRNPLFSTISFSQVSGTTVVFFTTNPSTALTIKYRHAGIEPSPGATYYMTGYAKRPDSDYESPKLFTSRAAATQFLAPMTITNDAAIANEVAWDQDEESLPGVVVCLVRDSDGDGVFTTSDYEAAIGVSEQFRSTTDFTVVNQFSARLTLRDSIVNMNDPTVARRRIGYFGYPVSYPIGDEFTAESRVFIARRELQVFEETVARGTLAIIGNSFAKKTILVDALGDGSVDSIPTEVTLDGSFLAVALAARVSSFAEPWQTVYSLPVSGFNEVEELSEAQMITLQNAGVICVRVDGDSAVYIGTMTTDETEASTQQLSGTTQRQYVLERLQRAVNKNVIGYVADSPEDAAQKLRTNLVLELGSMVSEGKIGKYLDDNGNTRSLSATKDVVAFRDRRNPTKAYFRASWYQKYPLLEVDGVVAVDGPTP